MILQRITSIVIGSLFALSPIFCCSWDYVIWTKSKKSDTPLFRFVVDERYGAGYIDRQGRVVIQPQYLAFGNHGGDFFGGLAKVTAKEGDFYIDATGKRVARFDQFGTADYVDPAGKLFIPANSRRKVISAKGSHR